MTFEIYIPMWLIWISPYFIIGLASASSVVIVCGVQDLKSKDLEMFAFYPSIFFAVFLFWPAWVVDFFKDWWKDFKSSRQRFSGN